MIFWCEFLQRPGLKSRESKRLGGGALLTASQTVKSEKIRESLLPKSLSPS